MKRSKLLRLTLALALWAAPSWAATLLPNGKQQFFGQNGVPLVGGSVATYIPGTTTPKTTWQDAGSSIPNTNPVVLDTLGSAIMYGNGCYRQQVRDFNNVLVWDQLSCDTSSTGGIQWGGQSTGTPNAQVITPPSFSATDGQMIAFMAGNTNTGAVTINAGTGAITLVKDTPGGNAALIAGDLVAGNIYTITYSTITASFHATLLGSSGGGVVPVGGMVDWAGGNAAAPPAGWLLADGACYAIATYPALYGVIGLGNGASCPSGQFPVPDMRGRVAAGVDVSPNTGTAGRITTASGFGCTNEPFYTCAAGTESAVLSTSQLPNSSISVSVNTTVDFSTTFSFFGPSYNNIFSTAGASSSGTLGGVTYSAGSPCNPYPPAGCPPYFSGLGPTSFHGTGTTGALGSGAPIYHVQPTYLVNKIIKT